MLAQQYRDLLIATIGGAFPVAANFQLLVNAARAGSWNAIVPVNSTPASAITLVVESADGQGWLRNLVLGLHAQMPNRPELSVVLAEIDRAAPLRTVTSPFDEVLLESGRLFVNRRELRNHLLELTDPAGTPILLVDGERQSGKTFSYYLINHVAPCKGYAVSRFMMGRLPKPDELADEILSRIGVNKLLPPIGVESAERWAEKLADIVARAIEERAVPRILVFDEFSDTPLPDGTTSFIVRLVKYSDEEMRRHLRVVLMRFRAALPSELDDIALRDYVKPFSATDMAAAVMQIAKAQNWSVSEGAVSAKIKEFHSTPGRTLKDGFVFLRRLLKELSGRAQ
jgi:hypothetical protein